MKKKMTRIFFLSYAPFLNYLTLKKNLENVVCKISQKVFELVLLYLVC